MRIGELADAVGVSAKSIRYYEAIGVLPAAGRTDAGYRIYGDADVERLAFIRRAQQLDLTLEEIREVLALREQGERPCGYVLDVARIRLAELDRRIAEMRQARDELYTLVQRAAELPEDDCFCQLIEHRRVPEPSCRRHTT